MNEVVGLMVTVGTLIVIYLLVSAVFDIGESFRHNSRVIDARRLADDFNSRAVAKAKHEDDDNGGYHLTDDEARSLGLAPDWREQVQMMREDENRE